MEQYSNKRFRFRTSDGKFRIKQAKEFGITGMCPCCGHILERIYIGDTTKRCIDPTKFVSKCKNCGYEED